MASQHAERLRVGRRGMHEGGKGNAQNYFLVVEE